MGWQHLFHRVVMMNSCWLWSISYNLETIRHTGVLKFWILFKSSEISKLGAITESKPNSYSALPITTKRKVYSSSHESKVSAFTKYIRNFSACKIFFPVRFKQCWNFCTIGTEPGERQGKMRDNNIPPYARFQLSLTVSVTLSHWKNN